MTRLRQLCSAPSVSKLGSTCNTPGVVGASRPLHLRGDIVHARFPPSASQHRSDAIVGYHSTEDGKPGHVFLGAFTFGIPKGKPGWVSALTTRSPAELRQSGPKEWGSLRELRRPAFRSGNRFACGVSGAQFSEAPRKCCRPAARSDRTGAPPRPARLGDIVGMSVSPKRQPNCRQPEPGDVRSTPA